MIKKIILALLILQVLTQRGNQVKKCTVGNYFDRTNKVCVACSTVTNADETQTKSGLCKCLTGFWWDIRTLTCALKRI